MILEEYGEDWSEKVANDIVFERIRDKRILLNILRRKGNWIGYIIGRNCLFHIDI